VRVSDPTSDEIGLEDEVDAVIVASTAVDWGKELRALQSRFERQRRRSELMRAQEQKLRRQLAGIAVDLERMEGVGGWTVRGKKSVLARLRSDGGPLSGSEFEVILDDTFHAL
jgi:hypothetical protein